MKGRHKGTRTALKAETVPQCSTRCSSLSPSPLLDYLNSLMHSGGRVEVMSPAECDVKVYFMGHPGSNVLMGSKSTHHARLFPTISYLSIPKSRFLSSLSPGEEIPTNKPWDGRTPLLCQSNEVQPSSAFYSFPI